MLFYILVKDEQAPFIPKSPKKKLLIDNDAGFDFYDNKVNLEIELEEASTIADDIQSVISDATEGMNNVVLKEFSLYKYLIDFYSSRCK